MKKGMIHNRDGFLDSVASSLGRTRRSEGVTVPDWVHRPQDHLYSHLAKDDVLDLFRKACRDVHAGLVETEAATLHTMVLNTIADHGGGPIIVLDDPNFSQFGLEALFERDDVYVWGGNQSIEKAEQANVGITFSEAAFAESGTVVSSNGEGKGRLVCMLPKTHIAIVPRSTIVPRMSAFMKSMRAKLSAGEWLATCVNFASGPSNSADIELKSVVGVHGPVRVTYILVADR